MKKQKDYYRAWFSAETIREGIHRFRELAGSSTAQQKLYSVKCSGSQWDHESEDEFFADYRRCDGTFHVTEKYRNPSSEITIICPTDQKPFVRVTVLAPTRQVVEAVFEVFERHLAQSLLPIPPQPPTVPPKIFIGHGRSAQWVALKDHLHEKHGYDVQAYETGERAGHTIRDILGSLLSTSTFAILVLTGDDEMSDGGLRARQNVVHELGLFQGRLGFHKAIALLELDTEAFSNIDGVQQIRFQEGRIIETFGDVLAVLRREFGTPGTGLGPFKSS